MILDERLEFCDATALNTGGAASYLIGDVIDLGDAPSPQDLNGGADTPLYLVITVDTAVDSAGDNTKQQFHLCSDAQAAIDTNGSATYHFSTGLIAQADLGAGARVCAVALPQGNYERYLGILHTTDTAAATAGKVNAFLTTNPGKWVALPQPANAA
jgi:hypothetical protein